MQSDLPVQPPPLAYYNPTLEPRRPASIKVLAIWGLLFGSYSLLSQLSGVIFLFTNRNFLLAMPGIQFAVMVIYPVLAGLLLVASINSVRLRPVGRRQMIWWALLYIVIKSFLTVLMFWWIVPGVFAFAIPMSVSIQSAWYLIFLGNFMLFLLFPILVLIFYRRPSVIAAFESASHKSASA